MIHNTPPPRRAFARETRRVVPPLATPTISAPNPTLGFRRRLAGPRRHGNDVNPGDGVDANAHRSISRRARTRARSAFAARVNARGRRRPAARAGRRQLALARSRRPTPRTRARLRDGARGRLHRGRIADATPPTPSATSRCADSSSRHHASDPTAAPRHQNRIGRASAGRSNAHPGPHAAATGPKVPNQHEHAPPFALLRFAPARRTTTPSTEETTRGETPPRAPCHDFNKTKRSRVRLGAASSWSSWSSWSSSRRSRRSFDRSSFDRRRKIAVGEMERDAERDAGFLRLRPPESRPVAADETTGVHRDAVQDAPQIFLVETGPGTCRRRRRPRAPPGGTRASPRAPPRRIRHSPRWVPRFATR